MDKWLIREAKHSDISFIYATWLNSYHYDSWTKSIAKSVFFDNYKRIIDELLLNSQVKVACVPADQDIILGYMVSEPDFIHYAFVKEAFRGFGIAKSLLIDSGFSPDDMIVITHRTKKLMDLTGHKNNLIYNPFINFKGV